MYGVGALRSSFCLNQRSYWPSFAPRSMNARFVPQGSAVAAGKRHSSAILAVARAAGGIPLGGFSLLFQASPMLRVKTWAVVGYFLPACGSDGVNRFLPVLLTVQNSTEHPLSGGRLQPRGAQVGGRRRE